MKKLLLKSILLLCALVVGTSSSWADTEVAVNDNLWSEPFKGTNTSSTFSATTSWGDYVNPTTFVPADKTSLVYSSSNAMLNSSSATNMNGAHVWLKKQTSGVYFQVEGIKLYNAAKVKVSWAQTGNAKVTVAYAFDGGTSYTDLSNNSSASAKFESAELSVSGHTTINLKFHRTNVNTNIRIDNLTLKVTEIGTNIAAPTINLAAGGYSTPQSATITTNEDGGTTYYTTNGSEPTNESTEYTGAISITTTTTLKAITYKGGKASNVVTAKYFFYEDGVFDFVGAGGIADYGSGVSLETNSSNYVTDNKTWTAGNVTMVTGKESGSGYRWWSNDKTLRLYDGATATFSVPDGYVITSIVTTDQSFDTATPGTLAGTTWTGATKEVTLKVTGNKTFKTFTVTYATAQSITPAKEYTTLTSANNLDFTNVSGLKAYIATSVSGGAVQMTQVNKVPANTGLVLKATTPGSAVNVPVFDGTGADDVSGNNMAGSATETTAVAANAGYILSSGIFQPSSGGTLPAGKAYLAIAVSSARTLEMSFDESDVTAISEVTNTNRTNNTNVYDLQGRKVAQPTKGLYIVNGKKVIIK